MKRFFCCMAGALSVAGANGAIYHCRLEGVWNWVFDPEDVFNSSVAVGEAFAVDFYYDPTSPIATGGGGGMTFARYEAAAGGNALTVTLGDYTYTNSITGLDSLNAAMPRLIVNDAITDFNDAFAVRAGNGGSISGPNGVRSPNSANGVLEDVQRTAITSSNPAPTSLDFSQMENNGFSFEAFDGLPGQYDLTGLFTSVTFEIVPEPATAAALTIGVLAIIRRRR